MFVMQVFYWLVPAKPSPAALRLQAEASRRPALMENGFRLAGLLAPAEDDPVAFGRCLYPDAEKQAALPTPDSKYRPNPKEEVDARRIECLHGHPPLALSPSIADAKVGPHWGLKDWVTLGEQVPALEFLQRSQQIWAAGPRGLGVDIWSPTPARRPLS